MKIIKSKKTKKHIVIVGCLIVLCLYIFLYIFTNFTFPKPDKEYFLMGEWVAAQGAEICVNNCVIWDYNSIVNNKELKSKIEMYVSSDTENVKLFIVESEMVNKTKDTLIIDLTSIHLESNEFSLAVFFPLFQFFNESSMNVELKPGETKKLIMPIPVNKISFSEKKWNSIEERDFYLVTSLFPTKTMIKIELKKQ